MRDVSGYGAQFLISYEAWVVSLSRIIASFRTPQGIIVRLVSKLYGLASQFIT